MPDGLHHDRSAVLKKLDIVRIADNEKKLSHGAYATLRHAITHLHLPPGQAFLEREIVDAFGISRTPVREALVRLEAEGWIRLIPRRGFAVSPVDYDNVRQIFEIIEKLDGLAGGLAAALVGEAELRELDDIIDRQIAALDADDLAAWAELDNAFHGRIVAFAGNPHLSAIMGAQSDWDCRATLYTVSRRPKPTRSIQEHIAIVAAMRASSVDATQIMMASHRRRARDEILDALRLMENGT